MRQELPTDLFLCPSQAAPSRASVPTVSTRLSALSR
jgi:hypothetical protein